MVGPLSRDDECRTKKDTGSGGAKMRPPEQQRKRSPEMAANTIPARANTATAPGAPAAVPALPDGLNDEGRRVWDALSATGGGTVAVIAKAAGTTQKITRDAIKIMFAMDRVVRDGDVWRLAPASAAPVALPSDVPPADAVTDGPATDDADTYGTDDADTYGTDDGATDGGATDGADTHSPDVAMSEAPAPGSALSPEAIASAMQIMQAESDRRAAASAELERRQAEEDARRAAIEAELARARAAEAAREGLAGLLAAVTAAYAAVADGADQAAIGTALAPVFDAVGALGVATGHARPRRARAAGGVVPSGGPVAVGDRKPPTPLRPLVAAHLNAHPGIEFTPGEIARVLDRSSGAVANALTTMANQGEAVLTCEKPMRYRAPATNTGTAPAPAPGTGTDATGTDADATTAA
ncbi:hypothetical protein [Actinomadura rupiterrae]|uniref:hypothetical protein n=1 Tax=Actinomadura rupiterrae TaxID=559627 RepID=UPI0020A411E2|nr:hypothetical protein [Actinomadura rupiterrae]MCP2342011.1 hypothetical protein [Actinomadura rupiterrae]